MTIFQAIILGIIQGLTEFLPISSSAHLVLTPFLFNWQIPEDQIFPFNVLVQLGTLVAVIIYFRKDLWQIIKEVLAGLINRQPFASPDSRLGWYLVLATIPAGLLGLAIKDVVEQAFNSPVATAMFLFGTAALLVIAEKLGKRQNTVNQMSWIDALIIGVFQAFAIFPGISRSGATITGGMLRKLDRKSAGRFSFLMSIPAMLAAGLLSVLDLLEVANLSAFLPVMAIGFISAAVVGYLSISWLLNYLAKRSLYAFSIYCAVFGTICLIVAYV